MTPRILFDRLLAALVFAALAAFVLFAKSVSGAPVPKRPAELTVEMMVGRFDYSWGGYPDGTIWLYPDLTYTAIHTPGSQLIYHGTYTVKGDTVTLTEWVTNVEFATTSGPATYAFAFDVKGYPLLEGTSNGREPVKLANPKR